MTTEMTTTVSPISAPAPVDVPARQVRLWPAVGLVCLYWGGHFVVRRLETFYFVGFLFNLGSSILLAVVFSTWWWTRRSVAVRSRLFGFLSVVVAGLIVEPFCHPSVGWWGLLMSGVPLVLTALTVWAVAAKTASLSPSWHRAGIAVVLVLALGSFTLIRIDGLDSELRADLRWRWGASAEELFLAEERTAQAATNARTSASAVETVSLRSGDWPEFRGPDRDGVIRGVAIAGDWKKSPPRQLWRQRVGPAWSSVIAVAGRVYTQEQRGEQEVVACYDAQTGGQLWAHADSARFWESVSGAGPRATPTFANGRIYALGGTGILNCLDAATGERRWSHDIAADAGARPPHWGFSGSPLVADGLVIVFAGGEGPKNLLAYRADTGAPAWSAAAGRSSYSSPQFATLAGKRQCLMLNEQGLTAVDPASGAVLWSGGAAMPGAPRSVQPHAVGPAQLLVGTYDGASVTLLDVTRDGDALRAVPRWESKDLRPEFPDFVVYDGHAYGFDVSIFCCIDLSTGKRCWKEGRYGRGQVMLLADQALLLVMSERGAAVLLAANPERHQELGRFQALDGKTWSHPVIAHGRLYARNAEEMACYELAPASVP